MIYLKYELANKKSYLEKTGVQRIVRLDPALLIHVRIDGLVKHLSILTRVITVSAITIHIAR